MALYKCHFFPHKRIHRANLVGYSKSKYQTRSFHSIDNKHQQFQNKINNYAEREPIRTVNTERVVVVSKLTVSLKWHKKIRRKRRMTSDECNKSMIG